VTVVGESGIFSRGDVEQLEVAGVDAVLVGEGLILRRIGRRPVRSLLGTQG
jgi:indole-3-glycerol phosphate synthase